MAQKNLINVTKINISLEGINNGKRIVLGLDAPAPYYVYIDGKRTDTIAGMEYPTLIPGLQFTSIHIKVPGEESSSIPAEKFQTSDSPIPLQVEGFSGRIYKTKEGDFALSATATAIKLA